MKDKSGNLNKSILNKIKREFLQMLAKLSLSQSNFIFSFLA